MLFCFVVPFQVNIERGGGGGASVRSDVTGNIIQGVRKLVTQW